MNSGPAAPEGFSPGDRLRKRREFEECYSSGVRVSGRHLQMFVLSDRADSGPRLGLSVPRRVGKAVTRNRIRRRLREIFRRNRATIGGSPIRIVINVRSSAAAIPFSELSRDYLSTLARGLARLPRRA